MPQSNDGKNRGGDDLRKGLPWLKLGVGLMAAGLLLMPFFPSRDQASYVLQAIVQPAAASDSGAAAVSRRGRLYVPLYSSITAGRGTTTVDLAATLSLRNVSPTAPLLIERIDYHDTSGRLVRRYIDAPQVLAPLGTIEVVIADMDVEGGTGAKFLADWAGADDAVEPLAEAVMVGHYGTRGLSFVSRGVPAPQQP